MHTIWTGSISFGLVNIPVRLYSAVTTQRMNFDLLREGDHCPIRYVRVCDKDGKQVDWEDIVKGYEFTKDHYIVLDDEDFEKAAPEESENIEIISFVDLDDIEPRYFKKPYLIEPEEEAKKPYSLLREAIKKSGRVGIAKFVMKRKEHLIALLADDRLLYLIDLRFQNELRDHSELNLPGKIKHSKKELGMAQKLIDQMKSDFSPKKYKDTYHKKLKKIIRAKAEDKEIETPGKKPRKSATRDLVEQLKESLS